MMYRIAGAIATGLACGALASGQQVPYQDPRVPVEKRVQDLLQRMRSGEKVDLLGGTGFDTKPVERPGGGAGRVSDSGGILVAADPVLR